MKRVIPRTMAFLAVFALVTGSVMVSCVTTQKSDREGRGRMATLNIGRQPDRRQPDRRLHTIETFSEIKSVVVVDERNRSRKLELSEADWKYDGSTTELTILRTIPFQSYIVHVEGRLTAPRTFLLSDMRPDGDLLVIVGDRLGIEGFDYSFDRQTKRLVLRKGLEVDDGDWLVRYSTSRGSRGIGEWKPQSADQMAYLEAAHRRQYVQKRLAEQKTFWTLEPAYSAGAPPRVVNRKPTPEERAAFERFPVSVFKNRANVSDGALTRELGFRVKLPRIVQTSGTLREYSAQRMTIAEAARNGSLVRELDVVYTMGDDRTGLPLVLGKADAAPLAEEPSQYLIDTSTIDLGVPVRRIRAWLLTVTDNNAQAVRTSFWSWTSDGVRLTLNVPSSEDENAAELIRALIKARRQ